MKKYIVAALKWALSKFEPAPVIAAPWPFPVVIGTPPSSAKVPAKKKRGRPALEKATTRAPIEVRFVPAKKKAVKKATKRLKALAE